MTTTYTIDFGSWEMTTETTWLAARASEIGAEVNAVNSA
jgi:hypothetical protein